MMNFLLAEGNAGSSWLLLGVFVVLMVLMLVVPSISNKKRMAAYREMQDNLKAGDKIQTIGGIVGRLVKIKDKNGYKTIVLETGDKDKKMYIEFDINAIAGIVTGEPNTIPTVSKEEVNEENQPEIVDVDFDDTTEAEQAEEEKPEAKQQSAKSKKSK